MAMPAQKLRVIPQDPNVMIERKMSAQEADMYGMVRRYRCIICEGLGCPDRLIIGERKSSWILPPSVALDRPIP